MKPRQNGFALVAAIVLVVVLAALTGFVATLVGSHSADSQLGRSSQLVERAAQTGLEWGGYQVMRPATPACTPLTLLPAVAAYPGVSVEVRCEQQASTEPRASAPGTVIVYRVRATAWIGGAVANPAGNDYAERQRIGIFSR